MFVKAIKIVPSIKEIVMIFLQIKQNILHYCQADGCESIVCFFMLMVRLSRHCGPTLILNVTAAEKS